MSQLVGTEGQEAAAVAGDRGVHVVAVILFWIANRHIAWDSGKQQ